LCCICWFQALEKVEGQAAWRVRHLLSLALCQAGAEGKPEDVQKTLAKALELATAANLPTLRVSNSHYLHAAAAAAVAAVAAAQQHSSKVLQQHMVNGHPAAAA
jgi:hypothetical protein